MAETELEVRLNNEIKKLQVQINNLSTYIKRVHGQVSGPLAISRLKAYNDANKGDLVGTANQVIVANGVDAINKTDSVTLSLPQSINTGASPTFNGLTLTSLTLTGLTGNLYVSAGTVSAIAAPKCVGLSVYVNNADALANGLVAGDLYRTGGDPDVVCVVV